MSLNIFPVIFFFFNSQISDDWSLSSDDSPPDMSLDPDSNILTLFNSSDEVKYRFFFFFKFPGQFIYQQPTDVIAVMEINYLVHLIIGKMKKTERKIRFVRPLLL